MTGLKYPQLATSVLSDKGRRHTNILQKLEMEMDLPIKPPEKNTLILAH
jgi:hypothetical protein